MSYFAELDENSVVKRVLKTDETFPNEGLDWLIETFGGEWVKTSYTSRGGNRLDPETGLLAKTNDHFRYNFAGPGYSYDRAADAFVPPQPYPSWNLNTSTYLWEAPIPRPEGENAFAWNEASQSWDEVK